MKNKSPRAKRPKFILALLALSAGLLFLANSGLTIGGKATRVFKVAVDKDYQPFSAYNPKNGRISGLAVDMASVICREAGNKCEFVAIDHAKSFDALENENIDVISVSPGQRVDIGSFFLSTEKFFRSSSVFVGLRNATRGTSAAELKGLKIGVVRGSIQDWHVTATLKDSVAEKKYEKFKDVMAALGDKEIDLGLVDIMAAYYYLQNDAALAFDVFGYSLDIGDGGFMLARKNGGDSIKKLNEAIANFHQTIEYESINAKYFDFFIF